MRGFLPFGPSADLFQTIAVLDCLAPILLLLKDVDQPGYGDFHVIGLLHQFPKQCLRPIKQARSQVVLAELHHGLPPLVSGQVGSGDQTTVNVDRPVDFTTTTEEVAQRQVDFGRVPIHVGHAGQYFNRLIGLVVDQVIQSLEIIGATDGGSIRLRDLSSRYPPTGSGSDRQ